jgi:hypothetical protein
MLSRRFLFGSIKKCTQQTPLAFIRCIQTANTIWRLSPVPAILSGNEAIRPVGIFSSSAG